MQDRQTAAKTSQEENSVAEAAWLLGPVFALFPLIAIIGMIAA